MSMTMETHAAGSGIGRSIRAVAARMLAELRIWQEERQRLRTLIELAKLDDALLRDALGTGKLYDQICWLRQPVVLPPRQW